MSHPPTPQPEFTSLIGMRDCEWSTGPAVTIVIGIAPDGTKEILATQISDTATEAKQDANRAIARANLNDLPYTWKGNLNKAQIKEIFA